LTRPIVNRPAEADGRLAVRPEVREQALGSHLRHVHEHMSPVVFNLHRDGPSSVRLEVFVASAQVYPDPLLEESGELVVNHGKPQYNRPLRIF